MKLRSLLVAAALVSTGACVKKSTYRAKVAELDASEKHAAELQTQIADLDGQIKKLSTERDALQAKHDELTTQNAAMEQRLHELGENVDNLTRDKADAAARLEELRKQKAAADARLQTYRDLLSKLKSMIDNGQLKVVIRDGRMIIALPNDILFDSGKTDVKKDGQAALAQVAQVLATIPDRRFLVAGHTDNVPIKTSKFPSNWELSTARAVVVTEFLIAKGMNPKVVAAGGYGEFDPVVPNDTPAHQSQNRRIEIVLQPNISDLPSLDSLDK